MYFKNEKEYQEYLKQNALEQNTPLTISNRNYFKWDNEGNVLLSQSKCQKSNIDMTKYSSCIGWILLDDGKTMALIKNLFGDVYRDLNKEDYNIAMYNPILLPEIAIQLQNKSAKYYLAKRETKGKEPQNSMKYVLTTDFKHKGEELVDGKEILRKMGERENELTIEKLIDTLEDYLIEYGYRSEDIKRCKRDFIKQTFFNKFIDEMDENNGNWAILINQRENRCRMAPCYDMDCSCGIAKKSKIQRKNNDGTIGIESFILQMKSQDWFSKYIEEVDKDFDLNKAFETAEKYTSITIPDTVKNRYSTFFNAKIELVKSMKQKIKEKEVAER
jgi:hypothetical protein